MSSSPSRIGISGQAGAAVKAAPFLRAGGCLDSGPGLPYRYDEEGEGAYPECVIRRGRRRLPRQRVSSTAKIGAAEVSTLRRAGLADGAKTGDGSRRAAVSGSAD